ncbi:MAG TPA: zinc-ribbon domain-containing protein [Gemmatimonadaceae bacterium]
MPLIQCPDCGKQISDAAPTCIHCGRPIQQIMQQEQQAPASSGPGVGTVAAGTFGGIFGCVAAPFILGGLVLVFLLFVATCAD